MPTWIHTAAVAAETGWRFHVVTPKFTRDCTQPGEVDAAGWSTWLAMPVGMLDWACSRPSKIQMRPKPMRRTRRATGSAASGRGRGGHGAPFACALRYCTDRSAFHATASTSKTPKIRRPWRVRAWWNAFTMMEVPEPAGGPPMPDMAIKETWAGT